MDRAWDSETTTPHAHEALGALDSVGSTYLPACSTDPWSYEPAVRWSWCDPPAAPAPHSSPTWLWWQSDRWLSHHAPCQWVRWSPWCSINTRKRLEKRINENIMWRPTSWVLGLGVFGFVEVTFERIETAGPNPRAAAFSWALEEPFPRPGWPAPPPPRLGGVLFLSVFGDFSEILKFSDVWRPFAKGKRGPCCEHTKNGRQNGQWVMGKRCQKYSKIIL